MRPIKPPTGPAADQWHLMKIVWHRRWTFMISIAAGLVGAIIFITVAPHGYRSTSALHVQQFGVKLAEPNDPDGVSPSLATQCELLRSSAILMGALEQPDVRQCRTLRGRSQPLNYLKKIVEAIPGKQSDIITVAVEASTPDEAALLVNSVVQSYIRYQANQRRSSAAEVLKILQKEKDKHEVIFRETNRAMVAFKQSNGTLSFANDKTNIIVDRLGQLSDSVTQAQLETLDAKVMLDAVAALGDDPAKIKQLMVSERVKGDLTGLSNDNNDLWLELHRLQRAAAQAREQYGPDHRTVQNLNKELDGLKAQMAELDATTVESYRAVLQQRYAKAHDKEIELRRQLEAQGKLAMELNTKAAEYMGLETESKRAEKVLDGLYMRINQIDLTADAGALNINVLETGKADPNAVFPVKTQAFSIALIAAVLLAFGVAMTQDWMDQRLRSPDEMEALLNMPVLGIIPHISGKQLPAERGRQVGLQPRSLVAEAYRTVRTAIHYGSPDRSKHKTLLVTSPASGDGKTTMASNLAIAIAQSGRRVLLIDADCRKPMQHIVFGMNNEVGLTSILLGRSTPDNAVRATPMENLDVLLCGPLPSNPSEALSSRSFRNLMSELASEYDQIVIDSPPVVPVTDAAILATHCDAAVLVIRADKSTRRISAHARDALAAVGAKVIGFVVNDAPNRLGSPYYHGGYYDYNYNYGYSKHQAEGEIEAIPMVNEA